MEKNTGEKFKELVKIMARMRAPDGCPWDREQTFKTVAPHTLEETHEVLSAIDRGDFNDLKEELGDLLLQIVFYAQMASEEKRFDIDDVIESISNKLIHRHPHVFGVKKVSGSGEVLKRWEELKQGEGKKSVVGGVPDALPALLKAFRLGEKTARVGFDWEDAEGILSKVEEEASELHEARISHEEDKIDHEYGDLLFTLANLGRFLGIDPEGALRRATNRFIERFKLMEAEAERQGRTLQSLSAKDWDELWEQSKTATKQLSNQATNVQNTAKRRWTLALLLNALVLPGSGHFLVGQKWRGVIITCSTTFFVFLPLIRYMASTVYALRMATPNTTAMVRSIEALSMAWQVHRGLIVWCLIAILILWGYGIIDLLLRKRKGGTS